jgi:ribonuclease P protein component
MKRAVREWFRRHRDELEDGVDIVVIVRREATSLEANALERELSSLTRRGGAGARGRGKDSTGKAKGTR